MCSARVRLKTSNRRGADTNAHSAYDSSGNVHIIGAADIIAKLLRPVTTFLGFPEECIPLAIVRPISGSGALACLETILSSVSPDSYSGRVASVLMGSTETTFYTIAVYFSAIKQKTYPSVFAAACLSDLMGFVFSALAVRLFFS